MSYRSLKSLLPQMDTIEGITEGGRNFKISYNQNTEAFYTQIFTDDDCVYEPHLKMANILKNNILSVVNKIDEKFFRNRSTRWGMLPSNRIKRKVINLVGTQEENPFKVHVTIDNNYTCGTLDFKNSKSRSLDIKRRVPDHIPPDQKHHWLYLHYQKPEVWEYILEYNIKNNYYVCCGNNILGKYNYCPSCGKKQEVNGLKITKVVGTELLTKLT